MIHVCYRFTRFVLVSSIVLYIYCDIIDAAGKARAKNPPNANTPKTKKQIAVLDYADMKSVDAKMLTELIPYLRANMQTLVQQYGLESYKGKRSNASFNNSNCISYVHNLHQLNSKYIQDEIISMSMKTGPTIVRVPRRRATALLTKAALTLPIGDFVETGVFYGLSAATMMKIMLKFDQCNNRKLWVFDSFEGLPALTAKDGKKGGKGDFNASMNVFINNMKFAGVWDDKRLIVTKGWFNDTCKISAVQNISFLRLDGDLYESTKDAIEAFYDRVVQGGFIYVDDYGSFIGCKRAIDEFRKTRGIRDKLHFINEIGFNNTMVQEAVWWVKEFRTD